MNIKRFVLACLAVFVFVFFYEWAFHGNLLQSTYAQTPALWRPKDDFMSRMSWLVLGQFVIAVVFCLIYTRAETVKQGVAFAMGYGVAIGFLASGKALIQYAVEPLPLNLIGFWFVGSVIEGAIAGAILGAIYRTAVPTVPPAG